MGIRKERWLIDKLVSKANICDANRAWNAQVRDCNRDSPTWPYKSLRARVHLGVFAGQLETELNNQTVRGLDHQMELNQRL